MPVSGRSTTFPFLVEFGPEIISIFQRSSPKFFTKYKLGDQARRPFYILHFIKLAYQIQGRTSHSHNGRRKASYHFIPSTSKYGNNRQGSTIACFNFLVNIITALVSISTSQHKTCTEDGISELYYASSAT